MDYKKKYNDALERARYVLHTVETAGCAMHKDLLTEIFPELAESEDERIRKELIEFIKWSVDRHFMREDLHQAKRPSEWIAYLEKQQEQKPTSFNEPYNPDEYEVVMEGNATSLKRKEQKPVEKQDYSGLTEFERAIHRGFLCAGVENVPVTIIKETAQDCLAQIPDEISYVEYLKYGERQYARGYKDGADSVKPVVCDDSVELSEEDEKMLDDIIVFISGYADKRVVAEWVNFLKSLHPSWKPSERQMSGLKYFLDYHRSQRNAGTTAWKEFDLVESLYKQLKKL